ncbi:MAG: ABC transporter ATP-binding protein [Acidothermaceae bacterium]
MTTLSAKGLRFERDGRMILDGIDFTVSSGERLAVLGPSGSGKTSLLTMLAGLAEPSGGQILVDDVVQEPVPRKGFGLVLQGYGLVSLLTASENVEAGLRAAGHAPSTVTALAKQALLGVGLDGHEDALIEELSGGQQQRVAVARAVALQPDVLLADEPTAEQDPVFRALVLSRLLEVADRGGVLVLATHDPEVAHRCTRTLHIRPESELPDVEPAAAADPPADPSTDRSAEPSADPFAERFDGRLDS